MIKKVAVVATLVASVVGTGPAWASAGGTGNGRFQHSCAATSNGTAACNAIVRTDITRNSTPSGYGPSDLQAAYNLAAAAASSGGAQTVGIVDAYNDPYAESDLAKYRSQYGLPVCTTANGCFKKVSQSGTTRYPTANGGWAQEISLDLDMVSAICPNCHILLVEASTASYANLGTAVNEAVKLGATEVSNSYGGSDSSSDTAYDGYYNHPGIAITASAGDSGYGVEYPAASPYVTAVGGTSLIRAAGTTRGWTESAWNGSGSGCSGYEAHPTWQVLPTGTCSNRAVADVSAVADPNTGVAVYDSYSYQGMSGWMVFGGTSVASPLIASVYALAGNYSTSVSGGSYPYAHSASLNDVAGGSNGSCSVTDLCTAVTGWDGPTGLGTPNGTGAF